MTLIPRIFKTHSFLEYNEDKVLKICRLQDNKPENRKRSSVNNNLM